MQKPPSRGSPRKDRSSPTQAQFQQKRGGGWGGGDKLAGSNVRAALRGEMCVMRETYWNDPPCAAHAVIGVWLIGNCDVIGRLSADYSWVVWLLCPAWANAKLHIMNLRGLGKNLSWGLLPLHLVMDLLYKESFKSHIAFGFNHTTVSTQKEKKRKLLQSYKWTNDAIYQVKKCQGTAVRLCCTISVVLTLVKP